MTATRRERICRAIVVMTVLLGSAVAASAQFVEQSPKLTVALGGLDHFGSSIALEGDTAVIGATDEPGAGHAYVFSRDPATGVWTQAAHLVPTVRPNGRASFGVSVAIHGDTVVVGAPETSEILTAQPPPNVGTAYIYARNQGGPNAWGQVATLAGSDAVSGDLFGRSVAVNGDRVVIGAPHTWFGIPIKTPGVAYVFSRNQGGPDMWGEVAKLSASDAVGGDAFGWSLALNEETLIVGATGFHATAPGGAAYVFVPDSQGPSWTETLKLTPGDPQSDDGFGSSIALSGSTAIVGAPGLASAYIFGFDPQGPIPWTQVAKLMGDNTSPSSGFGMHVALTGDEAIVGDIEDDAMDEGAAYVFARNQQAKNAWGRVAKLVASDLRRDDFFGSSVAISGGTALVGASGQVSISTPLSGAVYVFVEPVTHDDLQELISAVDALDLRPWPKGELRVLLQVAAAPVLAGSPNFRVFALRLFVDKVWLFQLTGQLQKVTATDLISRARQIIISLQP
jgi:hypothetical protein